MRWRLLVRPTSVHNTVITAQQRQQPQHQQHSTQQQLQSLSKPRHNVRSRDLRHTKTIRSHQQLRILSPLVTNTTPTIAARWFVRYSPAVTWAAFPAQHHTQQFQFVVNDHRFGQPQHVLVQSFVDGQHARLRHPSTQSSIDYPICHTTDYSQPWRLRYSTAGWCTFVA